MVINISRGWCEEFSIERDEITLKERGVITLILCGLFYYAYQKEKAEKENRLIEEIQVNGRRVEEDKVNATYYIIGASIPIIWFLDGVWDYIKERRIRAESRIKNRSSIQERLVEEKKKGR